MFKIMIKNGLTYRLARYVRPTGLRKNSALQYSTDVVGKKYEAGDKVLGYTVKKAQTISEFSARATHLIHDKTGAEHLHIAKDDENNFFCVALRTTPMDSTGVPHILEHTTLCGSDKFPVRDPFFKMLNRSLMTFANAFTDSDSTMYPFSTQNAQDYRNLMSVYLDAVFFPRLRETDFRQEGWRLEHSDLKDKNSPLVLKGVVYNEMKGVFASDSHLYYQAMQNNLLPDHTYAHVFGGDPEFIPDLTWQKLRQFHDLFYHPSNSKFVTYGTFPLEDHLEYIESHVLNKFDKIDPKTKVPLQATWKAPREVTIQCQPRPIQADAERDTTISVSYLCNDVRNRDETFMLLVLGDLLVGNLSAPFYKALIDAEPHIGSTFTGLTGYHPLARNGMFSVGLDQIRSEDVQLVKSIVDKTFEDIVASGSGLEEERIEAVLHQIDLQTRTQSDKFGLHLAMYLLRTWTHDADPVEYLSFNDQMTHFRQKLKENPHYLRDKVKEYFIDNTHKLTLVMKPDAKYEEKRMEKEVTKLNSMVSQLSSEEKEEIFEKGLELAANQDLEEDLSCLPSLKVSDIKKEAKRIPVDNIESGAVKIQRCEQPTNGITYFKAIANTRDLPAHVKAYVPLFCYVLNKIGADDLNYSQMSELQNRYTGEFNVAPLVTEHHTDPLKLEEAVFLTSHCLDSNVPKMFDLWRKVFNGAHLGNDSKEDQNRLGMLARAKAEEMSDSIADMGHMFAKIHSASYLRPAQKLIEVYDGITQVGFMKHLVGQMNLSKIADSLSMIANHVLNTDNLRVAVTATPEYMSEATTETEKFLSSLKHTAEKPTDSLSHVDRFAPQSLNTHLVTEFPNSYVGMCINTVPFLHEDYAKLIVLGVLLTNKFIHKEVREKGGAYGAGATHDKGSVLSLISYRDPDVINTINKFREAAQWVAQGDFTQLDIDEAKLRIFASADSPVMPNMAGLREFVRGIDYETNHEFRMRLFDVQKEQLLDVAERYLTPDRQLACTTVIGPKNDLLVKSRGFKALQFEL